MGWIERAQPRPSLVVTGNAVKIRAFAPGLSRSFSDIFEGLDPRRELLVDLRGNSGGVLTEAVAMRSRFLREPTHVGSIQFTSGRGSLAEPRDLFAEPHPLPWPGRLRVLIDAMTFSAAEDFLLGLQGLPHVTVQGTASGGGSGRPHVRSILPGIRLAVSTALTIDRTGRIIERNGIPADVTDEQGIGRPSPGSRAEGQAGLR